MQEELQDLIASKDVIILTGPSKSGKSWLIDKYSHEAEIQTVDDANLLDTQEILALCRSGFSNGKKMILSAQFRSQLPVINIASICNENRKSIINIDLTGWNNDKDEPSSFSSF